ncbi:hypothetical protein BH23PLA1_BH23PLA1_36360 [soil metagenome]
MRFLGVDLCGPGLSLVEAGFEPSDPARTLQVRRTNALTLPEPSEIPPWHWLSQALRLLPSRDFHNPERFADEQLKPRLQALAHQLADPLVARQDPESQLVLVYPYRMPPILHRYLPILFGQEPLKIRADHAPGRPVGLEAPVALAIEATVRRACPLPADLLLLTGSGSTRELTRAVITIESATDSSPPRLRVQVLACFALETPEQIEAARLADQIRGPDASLIADAYASSDAADLLSALDLDAQQHLSVPERAPADQTQALTLGAVRYAGLRSEVGHQLLDALAESIEVQHVSSNPLGVVGKNRQGEGIWYRLFPPLMTLPTSWAPVQSDEEGPKDRDKLLLAECLSPAHRHRQWLHQEHWEAAALSFHEWRRATKTSSMNPEPRAGLHAWSFQYRGREKDARSGQLHWTTQYAPPR